MLTRRVARGPIMDFATSRLYEAEPRCRVDPCPTKIAIVPKLISTYFIFFYFFQTLIKISRGGLWNCDRQIRKTAGSAAPFSNQRANSAEDADFRPGFLLVWEKSIFPVIPYRRYGLKCPTFLEYLYLENVPSDSDIRFYDVERVIMNTHHQPTSSHRFPELWILLTVVLLFIYFEH